MKIFSHMVRILQELDLVYQLGHLDYLIAVMMLLVTPTCPTITFVANNLYTENFLHFCTV